VTRGGEGGGGLVWRGTWRGRGPAGDSSPRVAAIAVCGRLMMAQGKQREREREREESDSGPARGVGNGKWARPKVTMPLLIFFKNN
jgi:hypothetical protein